MFRALVIALAIVPALGQTVPDFMRLIGTTSTNKTLYYAEYPTDWIQAHWICQWQSSFLRLAAIESREETDLLTAFFETLYGPNPTAPTELVWTAGSVLGGDIPGGGVITQLRWSTTGKMYEDWGYYNWCCRTEPLLTPPTINSLRACVAAEYRYAIGANNNMTVSWSIQACLEPRNLICMTTPVV